MAWIEEIAESQAQGALQALYGVIQGKRGKVASILRVQSLDAEALRIHLDLYMHLMFTPGPLSRREREAIAVAVSATNGCGYCVAHHEDALLRYERDPAVLERLRRGEPPLHEPRLGAIVEYARTLTRTPGAGTRASLDALRMAGLTDPDILRINLITAYFNFVNRIALGLGVATNEEEASGYRDD